MCIQMPLEDQNENQHSGLNTECQQDHKNTEEDPNSRMHSTIRALV